MAAFDLVIRGGTIFDGNGGQPFQADVAVRDGVIADVGTIKNAGREEINAKGLIVTPGFIDIHTHYDGQVTWEDRVEAASGHGVTTALMGNCGLGFAPCRPNDRDILVRMMEGIEDIPEAVMAAGLPWNWETFPEYLNSVAKISRDIDIAAQLPHSCLRVFAMGERGANGEPANEQDLALMKRLSEEAMRAGALGFSTSRTMFHRSSDGKTVPTKNARENELHAIAEGLKAAGHGVLQAAIELVNENDVEAEIRMLGRLSQRSGRPASYSLFQVADAPEAWRRALELNSELNQAGIDIKAQITCRATGLMLGFALSYNPFSLYPTYKTLADLPFEQRVEQLRRPEVRSAILSEQPVSIGTEHLRFLNTFKAFASMFPLVGEPLNYEPSAEDSVAAQAARKGVTPEEFVYDFLLENGGTRVLVLAFANFTYGNLDAVYEMLQHPTTLNSLGDGGAHLGMICDNTNTTLTLTHWTRDRVGKKLELSDAVKKMTRDASRAIGLLDRGVIQRGYKADINIIDYDKLRLLPPYVVRDLPAGGKRVMQKAQGYAATILSGQLVRLDGQPTNRLPGSLIRGPRSIPT